MALFNHLGLHTNNQKSFDEVDASALVTLKSQLESYSNELVFIYKYLNWKKPKESYPIVICTSVIYLLTWQLSIPLLCLLFLSLEALVLYDYFHTKLTSSKSKESTKQKEFDELCKVLLRTKKYMHDTMTCYSLVKQENPFWMCALTSSILICLALFSKILGDTLFSFVFINCLLYYPGLKGNGYVDRARVWLFTNIANVLRTFQGKKEKSS